MRTRRVLLVEERNVLLFPVNDLAECPLQVHEYQSMADRPRKPANLSLYQ